MQIQKNTASNIWKLYIIKASKWFMLFMPYIVPFYMENDLSMHQIMILQAIYSISIVAFEIPSGYFADVIGRRKALIMGTLFGGAGFLVYSFSFGFLGFLLAELVLGFGQSLISGADSALLYDSLLENQKEKKYIRYEGRMTSLGNIAEASAGIIGGLIALIGLRHNFYIQSGVAFLAVPVAVWLVEPVHHEKHKSFTFKKILHVVRDSLFINKKLRTHIFFSSVIGTATLTMAWFVQPYFKFVELPLALYGLFWTLLNLTVGFAAITAYRVERSLGPRVMIPLMALLIPAGYLILGQVQGLWSISILFLFYIFRGIITPILKDYIHRYTTSAVRATVLSIRNFIIRLMFVAVGPAMGRITDERDLQTALNSGGIAFLAIAGFIAVLFILSNRNR